MSKMESQEVTGLFSVPEHDSTIFHRVVVEHGDGRFSMSRIRPDLITTHGVTTIAAECTFTFDGVSELAKRVLAGDPSVREVPHAGKQLAAALLITLTGMGLTKVEPRAGDKG